MAKPDLQSILGIKKKAPPQDGPPPPPGMDDPNAPAGDEPDPMGADDAGGGAEGAMGGDLTPDMLDYHGADMACGSCQHFQPPATCDRWPDPVEEGGYCKGWQPQAQQSPNLGKMGGMPPGGPPPGGPAGPGMP